MTISLRSFFDLLIIGLFLYKLIPILKGSRGVSVLFGLLITGIIYSIANYFKLSWTTAILKQVVDNIIIIVLVLFHEELRKTFSEFGRRFQVSVFKTKNVEEVAKNVAKAVFQMAKTKTGSLIVFEREDGLSDIIDTGSKIKAQVLPELVYSIFSEASPLHDGAIVIGSSGEILSAGCFLPLSKDSTLDQKYGTRHRAGIGLSEISDALVVVVSEERGVVSLIHNGKISSNFNQDELENSLIILLGGLNNPETLWEKLKGFFKSR